MVGNSFSVEWYALPTLEDIHYAMLNFSITLIVILAGGIILGKLLPKSAAFHRLCLDATEHRDDGYTSAKTSSELLGAKGTTVTPLRPSGIGEFGDKRLDIIARGSFIDKSTSIVVAEVHGSRIIVEKV